METGKPIRTHKEVRNNPDPRIDQDFEGYPHAPAGKKQIKPETKEEKKVADADENRSKKTYGS